MKHLSGLFILCLLVPILGRGQAKVYGQFVPPPGQRLETNWKWQTGDDPAWANPGLDDTHWATIDPAQDIMDLPQLWQTRVGWLRLRFRVDSLTARKALALLVQQNGASEIYLNGQLIGKFGDFGGRNGPIRAATPPIGTFVGAPVRRAGEQVLAVRFAVQPGLPYFQFVLQRNVALTMVLTEVNAINDFRRNELRLQFDYFKFGLFFLLAVLHLALWSFGTARRANGYFFGYALSTALSSLLLGLVFFHVRDTATWLGVLLAVSVLYVALGAFLLTAIYTIFNRRKGVVYWGLLAYGVVGLVLLFVRYHGSYNLGITPYGFLMLLEVVRVTILSTRKKLRGASIIAGGCLAFGICYTVWAAVILGYLPQGPAQIFLHVAYNLAFISLPVAISIYLALGAAFDSRALAQKLREVEQLSTEKQQILATQNETLEKQVGERTAELQQSLADLKATQAQLIQKEKMASLGELTAGIAHEIQNPLNFVNNFSEVSVELVGEIKEERQKTNERDEGLVDELLSDLGQNLQKITHHGHRAAAIVRGMLEHSRASAGERRPTDLNLLAGEYLKLALHGARAKNPAFECAVETAFDPTLPKVPAEPGELGRVLLNLLGNAFDAVAERQAQNPTGYQPTVRLTTRLAEGGVEIRVADNGVGIPESVLPKLFQPFFTTKPTGQGTGLGLSLAYDIVTHRHGGRLTVESQPGQGAAFVVWLSATR